MDLDRLHELAEKGHAPSCADALALIKIARLADEYLAEHHTPAPDLVLRATLRKRLEAAIQESR